MNTGQQQKVESLRFYLFDRPLHPELFEIYRDEYVIRPAYEASLWITGCTHVVSFFRGSETLVEVTAGEGADLPERGLLLEMAVRGEKEHERTQADGINYMMNFQVEKMSGDVYSRTHHELARAAMQRGLFVPFPGWMSRSLTPFTYIDYDARPNQLHVLAFHAFPDELAVVKTQSIFELT